MKAWLSGSIWKKAAAWGLCATMVLCQPVSGAQEEGAAVTRHPLVYHKDSDIYRYNDQTGRGEKVTGYAMGPGNATMGSENHYYYSRTKIDDFLFENTTYTEDGRYLCHLDDLDTEKALGTLYFQDVQASGEQVVADYGVSAYMVLKDSRLLYMKEDEEILYLYDMDRREQRAYTDISDGLYIEQFNEDMTKALCVEETYYSPSSLVMLDLTIDGAGMTTFFTGIDDVEYVSADLMSIYYEKDDALYCLKDLKDSVKVGGDVKKIYQMDGARAYYLTQGSEMKVSDYFVDDMKEADQAMRVPYPTDYQKQVRQPDGTVTTQVDMESYEAAMKAYEGKQLRDEWREIMDVRILWSHGDLYYFDGNKSRLVQEDVDMVKVLDPSMDVLGVSHENSSKQQKIPLSQLEDELSSFYDMLGGVGYDYSVAVGGKLYPFGSSGSRLDYLRYMEVDNGQRMIYYLDDLDETLNTANMKSVAYGEGGLGTPQLVDTNVDYIFPDIEGKVFYMREDDDYNASVYTGGALVAESVYDYAMSGGTFYYFKNENDRGSAADLYKYDGQTSVLVAAQVSMFEPYADDAIAVLQDYDEETGLGTLSIWRAETGAVKIDDRVKEIKEVLKEL